MITASSTSTVISIQLSATILCPANVSYCHSTKCGMSAFEEGKAVQAGSCPRPAVQAGAHPEQTQQVPSFCVSAKGCSPPVNPCKWGRVEMQNLQKGP